MTGSPGRFGVGKRRNLVTTSGHEVNNHLPYVRIVFDNQCAHITPGVEREHTTFPWSLISMEKGMSTDSLTEVPK